TGATTVTVSNVSTAVFATASLVEVFSDGSSIGSAPGGTATVIVPVSPLVLGAVITAKQTVNGAVSPASGGITVTSPAAPPTVVINEFQYDDSGTDDREFVELYNFGSSPVDISGWILQASDELAPPADNNPDYTIPGAPGSNTTVLAAGAFYVLGAATVPNVNQIVGTTNLWENDNEALQLITGSGQIADTVVYELNKGPVAICPTEFGLWGNFTSVDGTGTRPAQSWSRWLDGFDTGDNGLDFGLLKLTPGTSNNQPDAGSALDMFEGGAIDADVPTFTGSFVNLRFIDPTVVSTANPNVIVASGGGTGGKAAIAWDNTGGGNMVARISEARFSNAYSLDVYISADSSFVSSSTSGEHEAWSIGFGTTDTFYNDNNADNSVPAIPDAGVTGANGDTGLAWKYLKWEDANTGNVGGQRLLLVNENDGGADGVTLFTVDPSHLTTGWHHLTLTRAQDNVSAAFDSDSFNGSASGNGPSTFFIGYRETIVNNALTRPPTIDNLQITVPTDIIAANPPIAAANPYEPGQPYRDVLQNRNTTNTVDQGIGAAGTPAAGAIQYSPILVTYSAAPTPTPMLGNVTIACTRPVCPTISAVTPQAGNTFAIDLSGVIPPLGCTTITFPDGKRVQYRSHPGNVNLDNASNTQDLLALVQAINNGSANQTGNLARYNIDRTGGVNTQDLLREVQLLNGVNTTQSFNGATVDACPP
ncbi:MAG TPA: lamin tail domain-containing protein, partial [Phycisphaerae bacterium]